MYIISRNEPALKDSLTQYLKKKYLRIKLEEKVPGNTEILLVDVNPDFFDCKNN